MCKNCFQNQIYNKTEQSAKTDSVYILHQSWSDKNWPVCFILQESASCRHVPFLHVHTYLTEYIALYTSLIKVNITKSCRGIFCIWNSIQEFMKFTLINEGKWICKHVLFHKLSIFWNYNALPALMCNMLSIVLMTLSLLLYYKSQFFGNLGCLTMSIHLMMRNAHSI